MIKISHGIFILFYVHCPYNPMKYNIVMKMILSFTTVSYLIPWSDIIKISYCLSLIRYKQLKQFQIW